MNQVIPHYLKVRSELGIFLRARKIGKVLPDPSRSERDMSRFIAEALDDKMHNPASFFQMRLQFYISNVNEINFRSFYFKHFRRLYWIQKLSNRRELHALWTQLLSIDWWCDMNRADKAKRKRKYNRDHADAVNAYYRKRYANMSSDKKAQHSALVVRAAKNRFDMMTPEQQSEFRAKDAARKQASRLIRKVVGS